MPDTEPQEAVQALPKESERRQVTDADARGMPLVLCGGERWYVPALPLSPRGQKIADLLDSLTDLNIESASAQRRCEITQKALEEASTDSAIDDAGKRLRAATVALDGAEKKIQTVRGEVAFHALRAHYRVTREEVDLLLTTRHWPDLLSALNGQESQEHLREIALQFFERMNNRGGNGSQPSGPFATAAPSGGPAPS